MIMTNMIGGIKSLREKIYYTLNITHQSSIVTRVVEFFLLSLIVLNVLSVVFETVEYFEAQYKVLLWNFEVFSVVIFTIEYALRLWTCTLNEKYRRPVIGRLRYIISFLAIVDLLAILPFYIPLLIPFDLRFLRAVRLFRLFRLFKLARYSKAISNLTDVLRSKRAELGITVLSVLIFLLLASAIMYDLEHEAQPQNFPNIPSAMWWGVVTLTTVGYGDIYPITPLGKFIGAIIALAGIGLFALPAGIIASGLTEQIHKKNQEKKKCPNCGHEFE
jgi:voltage-gated potassium channel